MTAFCLQPTQALTTLELLNLRDVVSVSNRPDPLEEPLAVRFRAINIDNQLTERHPKVALSVAELRVSLAMLFLEFREEHDRL